MLNLEKYESFVNEGIREFIPFREEHNDLLDFKIEGDVTGFYPDGGVIVFIGYFEDSPEIKDSFTARIPLGFDFDILLYVLQLKLLAYRPKSLLYKRLYEGNTWDDTYKPG